MASQRLGVVVVGSIFAFLVTKDALSELAIRVLADTQILFSPWCSLDRLRRELRKIR